MSGYNNKTGIYELTTQKMRHYLKQPIDQAIKEDSLPRYCASLFADRGFEVVRHTIYGIDVVADDAEVWEVLSGEPATFGRAKPSAKETYARYCETRQWFNPTELGKQLNPKIGAVKVNKLLEKHGYQQKLDSNAVWEPTELAKGKVKLVTGAKLHGHGDKKIPVWHRIMVDILQGLSHDN